MSSNQQISDYIYYYPQVLSETTCNNIIGHYNKDTFMSLYDYDDYVRDFVKRTGKLSGFDGKIFIPSEF